MYRGARAEKNLIDYAAFVVAFPQLIMGPILRYGEWRNALKSRTPRRTDAELGFERFVIGLCCKVLIADQLAPLWASLERIGFEYLSTPLAWLGAVSYSLQLYFDFHGYSLMAMGLGQMLGLPVPRNFDLPYTSCSVSEFYRWEPGSATISTFRSAAAGTERRARRSRSRSCGFSPVSGTGRAGTL